MPARVCRCLFRFLVDPHGSPPVHDQGTSGVCITQSKKVSHMNALIPVFAGEIAGGSAQLVDARALHGFLEVGKDFSTWIKLRIRHYRFQLNHDYLEFFAHQNGGAKTGSGGHNAIEYHLTLDMAKELAMVERNDKGRQARRYFIECERRLLTQSAPQAIPLLLPGDGQAQAGKRYLVTFGGDGQTYAAWPLEPDCCVMTPDQFVKNLHEFPLDADTLTAMITACAQRLRSRVHFVRAVETAG